MQCPECRSETPGSLGRCTRCDAPLPQADEAPWTPQVVGDPWPPEPWQPDPAVRSSWRPPEPVEEAPPAQERPWPDPAPQPEGRADAWARQPDPGWGGSGRPEVWGGPPQGPPPAQQQHQQPPQQQQQFEPPREKPYRAQENWLPDDGPRWRGPLVAGLVAALLTAAIVVGYVFWSNGSDDSDVNLGGGQSTAQGEGGQGGGDAGDTADDPAAGGDGETQAAEVDGLLDEMTDSRGKLAGITYTCANKDADIAAFGTAIEEREGQLSDAEALDVSAIAQGAELKDALQAALQASIDSNTEALAFLEDEDGCDGDAGTRLKEATDKATETKRAFLDLWNPIAQEYGLPTRTRDKI